MKTPNPPEELLTGTQAAALLGVHRDTLADYARSGLLPCQHTRPGGHRRYRRRDLEDFIRKAAEAAGAAS